MDDVRKQFNKLRNENVDLQQKAALANVYADELESLREKVITLFSFSFSTQLVKYLRKIAQKYIKETIKEMLF